MPIIISFLITFVSLWIMILIFDSKINNKMMRISLLTLIAVLINFVCGSLGFLGILIAGILSLLAIMKIFQYDFFVAFLFSMGLEMLQLFIAFGLFF